MTIETIRDIAIIILAILAIIQAIVTIALLLALWFLVKLLRRRSVPILDAAEATIGTVQATAQTALNTAKTIRGTTVFVSDYLAKPVIAAVSFAAGARRAIAAFTRLVTRSRKED